MTEEEELREAFPEEIGYDPNDPDNEVPTVYSLDNKIDELSKKCDSIENMVRRAYRLLSDNDSVQKEINNIKDTLSMIIISSAGGENKDG